MRSLVSLCIGCIIFFHLYDVQADTLPKSEIEKWKLYKRGLSYLDKNPDTTYQIISEYYENLKIHHDTAAQVSCLIMMADIQKNKGNYHQAYDHTWDAQLLAEVISDTLQQAECHNMLGMLYEIFNHKTQALRHKELALTLRKALLHNQTIKTAEIISNYFSIAGHYSRTGAYPLANNYLDTCMTLVEKTNGDPNYILAERAYIAIRQGQLTKAEAILFQITPYFTNNHLRYTVMIHYFWGMLKEQQGAIDQAITYYTSCLTLMAAYNTHTDIQPEVFHKLAQLHASKGLKNEAYGYLSAAKTITDSLFNARNNSDFLEVKNRYREAMQAKNTEIAQQQLLLDKRKSQNFRLKVFLGIALLVLIVSALLVKNWMQGKQYKEDQYKAKLRVELEREKHEEVLEVKNKEITSYTLQLIDKERIIDELLAELKKNLDGAGFRRIRNASKDSNKNLWKEFNERFTMVNSDFYKKLQQKHPNLSPTDLKHCALIKLNFSGKEMAQLLNISLPSVHIARHRIRKKFGLERKDNLVKYILDL